MRPFPVRAAVLAAALLAQAGCTDSTSPGTLTVATGAPSVDVNLGSSVTVPITLTRTGKGSGPVTLTVTGVSPGVFAVMDTPVVPEGTTTAKLTVTATTSAVPGSMTVTIRGSASGVADALTPLVIQVRPPVQVRVTPPYAEVPPGGTQQLAAFVEGTSDTRVTWTSSGPAVATVSSTGLVTALSMGYVYVTVRSVADTSKVAIAQISVRAVTVEVYPQNASLRVGQSGQMSANVQGTPNTAVTWSTSDQAIATITPNGGLLTGVAPGVVTVTATLVSDPTKKGTSTITVVPPPTPTPITSGVPVTNLSGAEDSEKLYTIVVPASATSLDVRTSGGTGDVDIVIRRGSMPVPGEPYDCASFNDGNVDSCTIANPASGTWYILVLGYLQYSGVTLTATVSP